MEVSNRLTEMSQRQNRAGNGHLNIISINMVLKVKGTNEATRETSVKESRRPEAECQHFMVGRCRGEQPQKQEENTAFRRVTCESTTLEEITYSASFGGVLT